MQEALAKAGHKYLKLVFVLALAGSSTLFFMGTVFPKPPPLVVALIAICLGIAIEWSYFTFSCDLSEAISEGNKGGIFVNLLYTLAGGVASWFLFTNAALHVGWAPVDDLIGLSRQQWAMVLAALIVVVIFVLSARRKKSENSTDLQSIGRMVTILLPNASPQEQLRLLSTIAGAAAGKGIAAPEPDRRMRPDEVTGELVAITPTMLKAESEGAKSNGHTTFRDDS